MTQHGIFYWNELMTWNAEAAVEFYGSTLGWTFDRVPMPDGEYIVAKSGDQPVGGIFQMSEADHGGVPENWFAYVAVDDVDARVAAAADQGAVIVRPPFDVPDVGRIAILHDPNGAGIGWMTPTPQQG